MMKYLFLPQVDIIPEWKKCYYDQQTLKTLIKVNERISSIIHNIQKSMHYYLQEAKIQNQVKCLIKSQQLSRQLFGLKNIMHQSNSMFYHYSRFQIQTIFLFVQLKQFSLKQKIDRITLYGKAIPHNDYNFSILVENTYIEVYYLKRMIRYNMHSQSKIVRQFQLHLYQYETLECKQIQSRKINRMLGLVNTKMLNLQKVYKINNDNMLEKQMSKTLIYGDKNKFKTQQSHVLGFLMGLCFMGLAVVLFIKQFHHINLDSNKTYQADFPIWRGASYFVAFQWILGFILLFLEQTHLNYKIILNIGGKSLPKSKSLFIDAAVTTLIYFLLISLYLLDMAKVIKTNFRYWGHIVWLVQIVYFLVPLPFTYYQGKLYFLKLVLNILLIPFAFTKSSIQMIWLSQQFVSFSQPISDFAYTICKTNDINAKCDMVDVSLAIIIVIFTYRIIINVKVLNQRGWILLPPYYGIFRAFSASVTASMSYLYRKYLYDSLFVLFICAAVASTLMATYADFRGDWGLLQKNSYALRKNLYFQKKYFYYICMFINFLLRCNWTLNLSPAVVNNMGVLPFYLIMIVTYFELLRRGIWNIFWLQCWHIQNCDKFMATIDDTEIQSEVKKSCSQNMKSPQNKFTKQQIQHRNKAQMQLVNQRLNQKQALKDKILHFVEQNNKKLALIQKKLSRINDSD